MVSVNKAFGSEENTVCRTSVNVSQQHKQPVSIYNVEQAEGLSTDDKQSNKVEKKIQESAVSTGKFYAEYDEKSGVTTMHYEDGTVKYFDKDNNEITDNKQKEVVDKTKPGAQWQETEVLSGIGFSKKSTSTWTRLEDGTSQKVEAGKISSKGRWKAVKLKSHYQADDKTPIFKQKTEKLSGVDMIVTENYDEQGKLKNKEYNLNDYNNNATIGSLPLSSALVFTISSKKMDSTVVDKQGNIIFSSKNGDFYDKNGKAISSDKANKMLDKNPDNLKLLI